MLSRIIRAPEEFGGKMGPETQKFYQQIMARDFADFEARFMRKHLGIDSEDGE